MNQLAFFRTTKGYPLRIEAEEVVVEESPVDAVLLKKMLSKLDYPVLREAFQQIKHKIAVVPSSDTTTTTIPESLPETLLLLEDNNNSDDDDETRRLQQQLHLVVFDIHVVEGHLVCPDTGRKFPIKEGIPNMILHEDEI